MPRPDPEAAWQLGKVWRFGGPCTPPHWKTLDLAWGPGGNLSCTPKAPTLPINPEPDGWGLVGFDDSTWPDVYIPPDPSPLWTVIPDAQFLSSQARAFNQLRNAEWLARTEFYTPNGSGTLYFNVDDYAIVYLDGEIILNLTTTGTIYYTDPHVVTSYIDAGTHCLAAHCWQSCAPNNWLSNPNMIQPLFQVDGIQYIPPP